MPTAGTMDAAARFLSQGERSDSAIAPDTLPVRGAHELAGAAAAERGVYVVSLNIQFARQVERVCRLFENVPELSRAQVVLLQEMDPSGTEAIARCLGMSSVYHLATVHVKTGRDFGNAVLSAWPIVGSRKIELPHPSLRDRSRRVATCATLAAPVGAIEVCSLHLATPLELLPGARREQLRAALSELRGAPRVILGGDFNSYRLGKLVPPEHFEWATRRVGGTLRGLSVDHIFAHGLRASDVGKVVATLGATDHAAVWARLVEPAEPAPASAPGTTPLTTPLKTSAAPDDTRGK